MSLGINAFEFGALDILAAIYDSNESRTWVSAESHELHFWVSIFS